ncbi:hypothetical protein NHX12_021458 [Muraenolepis orangiensis]|uniref:Uncharacterized protein n=1 Tax=Muraenolepis orangiensis TaxID=630683 RepID=A0A9Q0IVJ8_9TELE|nr:hypothetical protein NHX12_021458 [Muraenolepis orangiensis]
METSSAGVSGVSHSASAAMVDRALMAAAYVAAQALPMLIYSSPLSPSWGRRGGGGGYQLTRLTHAVKREEHNFTYLAVTHPLPWLNNTDSLPRDAKD